jgi:hypothetical protein
MRRRDDGTEMAISIYHYRYAGGKSHSADSGEIRARLPSRRPDPDSVGFSGNARAADIDIVTAIDELPGPKAQCNIVAACYVTLERSSTNGSVEVTRAVVKQCCITAGGVLLAGRICPERGYTDGCVLSSSCVETKRLDANGRVIEAFCVGLERKLTSGRVEDTSCVT